MNQPVVKLHDKPSDQAVAKAVEEFDVAADNGKVIRIRQPGVLAQFRLVEALGSLAENQTYTQMVMPLIYVVAIDGDLVPAPANKLQIEGLIQRLDYAGLKAIMNCVEEHWGAQQDPEKVKDALKK